MPCGVAGTMEKGQLAVQRETHLGCWTAQVEKLAVKAPPVDAHVPKSRALKISPTMGRGMGMPGLKCLRWVWTGHTRLSYFWTPQVIRAEMQPADGLMSEGWI